jgi:hypothetical protein
MMKTRSLIAALVLVCTCILATFLAYPIGILSAGPFPSVVLQRSYPITLTNLRNTITNFGTFGTRFGASPSQLKSSQKGGPGRDGFRAPFSSCEWPAGSRNLYLFDGELWVGAKVSGDTAVTTGRLSGQEWTPVEEFGHLYGVSAFSDEDTYTRYHDLDGGPAGALAHLPLGIQVSQRIFAWAGADYIVHDLLVENVGTQDLEDVYVGFCWDFNISTRARTDPAVDDLVGFDAANAVSYMYDDDGDDGRSPGYIGGTFLNTPLSAHGWWTAGSGPAGDAHRYALLSGGIMADPTDPDDYRLLHAAGPFDLPPGRTVPVLHVLAIGDGLMGLQQAVAGVEAEIGQETAAEGDSTLSTGEEHIIAITLGESKRQLAQVQFAVDWEFCDLSLNLVDPEGTDITPDSALTDPLINYTAGSKRKFYDIADPLTGEWEMHISYLSGPPEFDYRHSVTITDVPYDYGFPMASFTVYYALIDIFLGTLETCYQDSFRVEGHFELRPESDFDPGEDPVLVRVGPYEEVIPPGSFQNAKQASDSYEYCSPGPGVVRMRLDFADYWFEIDGSGIEMDQTINPVLVRVGIGEDTGWEILPMDTSYSSPSQITMAYEEGEKSASKSTAPAPSLPRTISLDQNYPNPFNASTRIDYRITQCEAVTLALYNVSGQRIALLVDEVQPAGAHQVVWNGRDASGQEAASGIYFCHLRVGGHSRTRKMILLR